MYTQFVQVVGTTNYNDKAFLQPQFIREGIGFSLRPYIDTHIGSNGMDPTNGYKFTFPQCPLPPAVGPYIVIAYFKDGQQRQILVTDDRPYFFDKPFKWCDLVTIGWGSATGSGSLIQLASGRQSALAVDVYESSDEYKGTPAQQFEQSFPLFWTTANSGAAHMFLPKTGFANFPYQPSVRPAPVNPINWWGINDECAFGTAGNANKLTVGAFYVFPQFKRWRVALTTSDATASIDIWSGQANGQATGSATFNTNGEWTLNENIDSSQWNADGTMVIERTSEYQDEWIQLAANGPAGSYVIEVDMANAVTTF